MVEIQVRGRRGTMEECIALRGGRRFVWWWVGRVVLAGGGVGIARIS